MLKKQCIFILAVTLSITALLLSSLSSAAYIDASTADTEVLYFECLDMYNKRARQLYRGDTITAKATLKSAADKKLTAYLITAVYESGILTEIGIDSSSVNAGDEMQLEAAVDIPSENNPERVYKAFLWDMTDGAQYPLSDPICLKPSGRTEIFVAENGNDSGDGSRRNPYASIERAQEAVQCMNENMTSDIDVNIEAGVYRLADTWELTERDSGSNGYRVKYRAVGRAVISGGEEVTGWENVGGGLYRASYSGKSLVNELYVDGVKAQRAASKEKITPYGFYYDDEDNLMGVKADLKYSELSDPEYVQLRYSVGWKSFVFNVKDIINKDGQAVFIMDKSFNEGVNAGSHAVKPDSRFYLENVYEYLDEPGEFYYDRSEGYIYYMSDGENMSECHVYVPVLEQLVNIEGSDSNNKVKDITFDGITFAHCTWNYPIFNGYIGGQAQSFSGGEKETALDEAGVTMVDAGVQIRRAENIEIVNGAFTGISKVGIGLYNGAADVCIEGNVFYSLGDSAVTIGAPSSGRIKNVQVKAFEKSAYVI